MPIFPDQETHQIDLNSHMCLQGVTTATQKISEQKLNTFSIDKYASTVYY